MSPLANCPSSLVGLNHSLNNYQWSSKPHGVSVDSSFFPLHAILTENFARNPKILRFLSFKSVKACKWIDWNIAVQGKFPFPPRSLSGTKDCQIRLSFFFLESLYILAAF